MLHWDESKKNKVKRQKSLIPLYRYTVSLSPGGEKLKKVHELHELPRIKEPKICIDLHRLEDNRQKSTKYKIQNTKYPYTAIPLYPTTNTH
jgi:hypothetical protein